MANDHSTGVGRVDPHVVVVAAGHAALGNTVERLPAIQRPAVRGRQEVRFVLVVGRDRHARVVGLPPGELTIIAHDLPLLAAVIRTPEDAAVGLLAVEGDAVAGFDQRVDAVRVGTGDGEGVFAGDSGRQSVAGDLLPGGPAVGGLVEAASRPAALATPGVDLELPHAREQDPRIARIHRDVGTAGVPIHEQHAIPGFPPIQGAVDAAFVLRAVGVAEGAGVHHAQVRRVNQHTRDAAGIVEAHVGPGLSRVGGTVDPVADRDVAANERFPGAGPHDVGIRGRHRERPDGGDRLFVEDRLPVNAAVRRFPDAAGCGAGVVGVRIAGDACYRGKAVSDGADVAVFELAQQHGVGGCLGRLRRWRRRLRRCGWLRPGAALLGTGQWREANQNKNGKRRHRGDQTQCAGPHGAS